MNYFTGASRAWFGYGQDQDVQTLHAWQSAPLTFTPEQDLDNNWNIDRYEVLLGQDESGEFFQRAADLTLRNRFYPAEVMSTVSDYQMEDRPVQRGDHVLQRIRLLQWRGQPILEILTLNEITAVTQEAREAGFTYTTTRAHSEIGEWSPRVVWKADGKVFLIIEVISRLKPGTPHLGKYFARQLQIRAHKLSIDHFMEQLTGAADRPAAASKAGPGDLLLILGIFAGLLGVLRLLFPRKR